MQNQESETSAASPSLQWKWVSIGVAVGAAVIGVIVGVTASAFHNLFIPSLIACTGFVVTGIIVGYYSPGITVREAAVGGAILAILLLCLLGILGQRVTLMQTLTTIVFGYLLAFVGGWVGENLQEDRSEALRGMQWRWVGVGMVVSVVLNSLGVFGLAPLLNYSLTAVFVSFLVTFVIAGYVVGYFSAGVTIKEAALAGLLTVLFDWGLVAFGFGITIPMGNMLFAMTAGFLLSMVGAWAGERLQESMQQQQKNVE